MHYSPQDLQLGAEVQAQIDLEAGGQKFALQYGTPPPEEDNTAKLVGGAILVLAGLWIWKNWSS